MTAILEDREVRTLAMFVAGEIPGLELEFWPCGVGDGRRSVRGTWSRSHDHHAGAGGAPRLAPGNRDQPRKRTCRVISGLNPLVAAANPLNVIPQLPAQWST